MMSIVLWLTLFLYKDFSKEKKSFLDEWFLQFHRMNKKIETPNVSFSN